MNPLPFPSEPERRLNADAADSVSVLIRTMGRASLADAIASVRSQSFPEWHIIILNAGGQPIDNLPRLLEGVRSRVLVPGGIVDRARAANLLLEAADSEFALFLDDDDWLLPDHLGKLVSALRAQPELVAAYGDVEAVAGARTAHQHLVHTFQNDFDPVSLQLQNYLPIHAVMFRVDVVRADPPSRFDPSMTLFEDWDFWLQLAVKGPFQRVPGVSAVYAYEVEQGSSHARGPERQAMLAALGARQLARWRPQDVAQLVERDAARNNLLNDSVQQAAAAQAQFQDLSAAFEATRKWCAELNEAATRHAQELAQVREISDQRMQALAEQGAEMARQRRELDVLARVREDLLGQITTMQASASWRLTRPLRGAGRAARQIRERLRVWLGLATTVRSQVRRHGAMGFARRLPYYLRHRDAYLSRLSGVSAGAMRNPFGATALPQRDIPLHPDLEGAGEPFDVKVSVVIPTLNAGTEFGWLLRKLRAQRGVREIQIVVVDSGSNDDTVALAHGAGATVVSIAQSEFSHSYSRNRGAEAADGDYLLFMVQDAFPIGEYWLYGMVRFLRDPAHERLAAVSCSEASRSDSDLMYDSMIDTHYRFLDCREQDRVGRHLGNDHMSLRSQGQLSDVSCLIGRELFGQYRYQGDYAEDLDLGIRLIKDGWKVAMLASVKVVHSHNRPAWYYLKRSFVDVQFLVGLFDDFTYPHCNSLPGLAAGIASASAHVSRWLDQIENGAGALTGEHLRSFIGQWRDDLRAVRAGEPIELGDQRLATYLGQLTQRFTTSTPSERDLVDVRQFAEMLMGRLEHFSQYTAQVYDLHDELPRRELAEAIRKTLAATAGSALGFYCLDHRVPGAADRGHADAIHGELTAGV